MIKYWIVYEYITVLDTELIWSFVIIILFGGADPGINYEGQAGVHKNMNIITKGEGVFWRQNHS